VWLGISKYLSIIILNVNSLNSPIKSCRLAAELRNKIPTSAKDKIHDKDTNKLKVKG
jgi:hypothetical protein